MVTFQFGRVIWDSLLLYSPYECGIQARMTFSGHVLWSHFIWRISSALIFAYYEVDILEKLEAFKKKKDVAHFRWGAGPATLTGALHEAVFSGCYSRGRRLALCTSWVTLIWINPRCGGSSQLHIFSSPWQSRSSLWGRSRPCKLPAPRPRSLPLGFSIHWWFLRELSLPRVALWWISTAGSLSKLPQSLSGQW